MLIFLAIFKKGFLKRQEKKGIGKKIGRKNKFVALNPKL